MRVMEIYRNAVFAGILTEENREHFVFRYDDAYFKDSNSLAISLTLPKTQQSYSQQYLFPVFFNTLREGANKQLQCRLLKIDETDHFGLLMAPAEFDTLGAITVKPISPLHAG